MKKKLSILLLSLAFSLCFGLSANAKATTSNEKPGWHKTQQGKKYYVKSNGKRAYGYTKIKSKNGDYNYYYFYKSSYMATNKWKYVNISGRKYKLYFRSNGKQAQNVESVIGERSSYKLEVNLKTNLVIAYAKDIHGEYTIPVKAMLCSVGTPGNDTPTGNYYNLTKAGEQWGVLILNSYGKYCTRIVGSILFHSSVYTAYGNDYSLDADEYEKLGTAASHGCIRLTVKNAKWIQDRCYKCSVRIFRSSKKAPLKKPKALKAVRLPDGAAYDPTDIDIKKR